jgi:hypothetical protein
MAEDHVSALGFDHQKRSVAYANKTSLFAAILVVTHLLKIQPSELDAGGLKITIEDVSVVHGAIALVFLYHFSLMMISTVDSSLLLPISRKRAMMKAALRYSWRLHNDTFMRIFFIHGSNVKQNARDWMVVRRILTVPFYTTLTLLVSVALCFAFVDFFEFVRFAFTKIYPTIH